MPSRPYEEQYTRVMRLVWGHPGNDQRATVLRWLARFPGPFGRVLDVGPGDSYYLGRLKSRHYTLVEPNTILRRVATAESRRLGVAFTVFPSVAQMLRTSAAELSDLVLLIHVLLYLELDEIKALLPAVREKPLLLVYPQADGSATVEFEESVGLSGSRERILLKNELLGRPSYQQVVPTHFRLPLDTALDSLAFLIAHAVLQGMQGREAEEMLDRARFFVRQRIHSWRRSLWYEIPQPQVLEAYNIHAMPPPGGLGTDD